MPIRPEFRHFYTSASYRAARKRVQERAGDACEYCGKYNGSTVETVTGKVLQDGVVVPYMFWRVPGAGLWHARNGRVFSKPDPAGDQLFRPLRVRTIRVKCGAAHLNHTPGDDRDQNLAFLCDYCHFHLDADHHHQTRGARKDAARPILAAAAGVGEVS